MTNGMFSWSCKVSSGIVIALALFVPGLAGAQEPVHTMQELQSSLSVGDTIRVSGTDGKNVQGELESASASSLRLKVHGVSREFREPQIREVRVRYTDSVWDGLWKGALIGLAAGAIVGAAATGPECKGCSSERAIGALAGGFVGAFYGAPIGLAADFFKKSYTTAYKAPQLAEKSIGVSPILSKKQKGVAVAFRF